ncbi:hypothetical protein CIK06_03815 [Plantactinospora sp. KBS50]|nr:hypothetical protein CIK06_03815 [Plantactinospora sp. KBS50]
MGWVGNELAGTGRPCSGAGRWVGKASRFRPGPSASATYAGGGAADEGVADEGVADEGAAGNGAADEGAAEMGMADVGATGGRSPDNDPARCSSA